MTSELLPGEKAPIIIAPLSMTPKTPVEFAKGKQTQTMEFPKPVHLTVAPNETVFYPAGVHEVPVDHVDHWYLKAHDARAYNRPVAVSGSQQSQPRQQQGQRQQGQRQNGR